MLPLTIKCVRDKSCSSAALRSMSAYWNALGNASSCPYKSEAKVAPAQYRVLLSCHYQLSMRWEMLSLTTTCVPGKSSSSAMLWRLPRRCQIGVRWRMPPLTTNCVRGWGSSRARAPRSAVQGNSGDQRAPKTIVCEQSAVPTDEGGTGQCRSWTGVRSFLITHPALHFHSSWRIVAALVRARWRIPPLTTNCVRGWGSSRARAPRSAVQ